jgi:hypothetical protein
MHPITWMVGTLVSAFVGSYLAGYFKRKGENLATHEDIDKLLDEVSAVTQATKQIESKISIDMWGKQKQWEIKKDALFEVLKELGSLQCAMGHVTAIPALFIADTTNSAQALPGSRKTASDLTMGYIHAYENFARARMLALLVCGAEAMNLFMAIESSITSFAAETISGKASDASQRLKTIADTTIKLTSVLRRELEIAGPN